jgi:hypothetical protein
MGITSADLSQNFLAEANQTGSPVIHGTQGGSGSGSFTGLVQGKRGAIAYDSGGELFWAAIDVTASPINWNGSTSNVPGVNGGIATGTFTDSVYPLFYTQDQVAAGVLYTLPASFEIPAIPSGFAAWATPGVAGTTYASVYLPAGTYKFVISGSPSSAIACRALRCPGE